MTTTLLCDYHAALLGSVLLTTIKQRIAEKNHLPMKLLPLVEELRYHERNCRGLLSDSSRVRIGLAHGYLQKMYNETPDGS